MPFIKHRLGNTFYELKGSSNNKNRLPVIYLHGGPGGSSKNSAKLFNLNTNRQIIFYDQIGGGRSSAIGKKHWRIESFVYELDYLASYLNIDSFHIYSGSWGTTLALEFYLRKNKNRVKSIVFQSPLFCTQDWANDATILIKALPSKTQRIIEVCHEIGATDSAVYRQAMQEYYLKHVLRNEKKLKAFMKSMEGNINGRKIYEYMWGPSEFGPTGTLKNYNRVKDLKKIKIPTLFIAGEYDEARPVTVKKYKDMTSNAKIEIIPNASHALLQEEPKKIINICSRFYKDVENNA
ncbi:MAG: proline iminopeptidase-family hydrolase [Oligoflexia bacterium]|nr:proline iminopeptidase-family hydrolase [Oligoflexia bacterium]